MRLDERWCKTDLKHADLFKTILALELSWAWPLWRAGPQNWLFPFQWRLDCTQVHVRAGQGAPGSCWKLTCLLVFWRFVRGNVRLFDWRAHLILIISLMTYYLVPSPFQPPVITISQAVSARTRSKTALIASPGFGEGWIRWYLWSMLLLMGKLVFVCWIFF